MSTCGKHWTGGPGEKHTHTCMRAEGHIEHDSFHDCECGASLPSHYEETDKRLDLLEKRLDKIDKRISELKTQKRA
jgi:hypothetical protein